MSKPERRHSPRTTMERLASIQIEPDNGGIVLNVSGEGLCFHSIAPVEKNENLCFSLLEQNRRIAACGELAWTDELGTVGGMRFTTLPAEAREQVQSWISQPAAALEEHETSTLGSALLKAFPRFRANQSDATDSNRSSAFAAVLGRKMSRSKVRGFTAGVVTGLLISAVSVSVFLLHAHRSDIGESLIRLGERLAAKADAEKRPALLVQQVASETKQPASAVRTRTPAGTQNPVSAQTPVRVHSVSPPASARLQIPSPSKTTIPARIPVAQPIKLLAQPLASAAKQQQPEVQPALSTDTASHAANSPVLQHSADRASAGTAAPTPSTASEPEPVPLVASLIPNKLSPLPPPAPSGSVQVTTFSGTTSASPPQMYFELGKFKDEIWAHNLSDKVAQFGLHPSVIQKGHLWRNSFYVLVGPYGNQEEASRTQKDLVSHGYKPRPFERGSRAFSFASALTLGGARSRLPVGDFTITWESYVTDATVKFAQGSQVLAMANGQWVNRPGRYERNEYVYLKSGDGSRVLREIHFSGLDRALVFRNAS